MERRGIIDVALSARETVTPIGRRAIPDRVVPYAKWFVTHAIGPELLHLLLPDLRTVSLAPVAFPDGYQCLPVKPGREADYIRVMTRSLVAGADDQWFEDEFRSDPGYDPANLFLVYCDGTPVAAGAAQDDEWEGCAVGRLHMLGVAPEHRRRGLGTSLTLTAIQRMKDRGFDQALVLTEDSRLGAINLYLQLGLQPLYPHPVHRVRWKRVMKRLRLAGMDSGSSEGGVAAALEFGVSTATPQFVSISNIDRRLQPSRGFTPGAF